MKISEAAKNYGVPEDAIRQALINWQCAEGYDAEGCEYETETEWLEMCFGKSNPLKVPFEPYQKGDEFCE